MNVEPWAVGNMTLASDEAGQNGRRAPQPDSEPGAGGLQNGRGYTYYLSDLVCFPSPLDEIDNLLNPLRRKLNLSYPFESNCLWRGFTHGSLLDVFTCPVAGEVQS